MAMEIGAATEDLGIAHTAGIFYPWSKYIWPVVQEPNSIWVNKRGERFIDETVGFNHFESANPVYRQPDKISYTLFDAKIIHNIMEKGFVKGLGLTYVPGARIPDLDKKLQAEAGKGRVKISDSWGEIADWIGAAPEVLKATIAEYNSSCEEGYDKVLAKDPRYLESLNKPPYYAIKSCLRLISTIGGIKINHNMEVLDNGDNPIQGLYAGGVDVGGWSSHTYNVILSGKAFGFAVNSGRIAGENAARYVLKKWLLT
jgi:fumarate reductase flavoprotein subunit